MNTFELLEKWRQGHKSRTVSVYHSNDHSLPSCWNVLLEGKGKDVLAEEVPLVTCELPKNHVTVISQQEMNSDTELVMPGLEKVILLALSTADKLGL